MPPKNCARCQKIVYPTEELKCLDVVWHKICFKCEECGMSLNVKTFKAFEKKPYCPAHVPKLQATFVADTPESRRLAENSKIQSQVQYHQDFERLKGQYLDIGLDNPEIQRAIKVANTVSNVKYHEEFEKSKGTRTAVTDDPEMQRIRQNTAIQSGVAYKGIQQQRDLMEQKRPTEREIDDVAEISQQLAHSRIMGPPQPVPLYTNGHSNGTNGHHHVQQQNGYSNGYHHHSQQHQNGFTNGHTNYANGTYSPPESISPPSDRSNGGGYYANGGTSTKIYSHEDGLWVPDHLHRSYSPSGYSNHSGSYGGGYVPPNGNSVVTNGNSYYSQPASARDFRQTIKSFDNGGLGYNTEVYYEEEGKALFNGGSGSEGHRGSIPSPNRPGSSSSFSNSYQPSQPLQQQRKVGSIADYDPVNGQWGTIAGQAQQLPQQQYQPPPQQQYQSRGPQPFQTQSPPQMASPGSLPQQQQQRPVQQQQQQPVDLNADVEALNSALADLNPSSLVETPESPQPFKAAYENMSREEPQVAPEPPQVVAQPDPEPEPVPEPEPEPEPEPVQEEPQPEEDFIKEGVRYRAMYDYEAMEEDECTFFLDDLITNVRRIDDGWVVGTVQRTGRTGMIPANYIEPCA